MHPSPLFRGNGVIRRVAETRDPQDVVNSKKIVTTNKTFGAAFSFVHLTTKNKIVPSSPSQVYPQVEERGSPACGG